MSEATTQLATQCVWWFELIRGLPAAIVTGLITALLGGLALKIQRHQADVALAKLNLDLFERRYEIFDVTWSEISSVLTSESKSMCRPEFTNLIPKAEFIFGSDISEYMRLIVANTSALWRAYEDLKQCRDAHRTAVELRVSELTDWFSLQAKDGCRTRFGQYLDFSKWR